MNKKTLLGGAAALLLGAGFLAAPASASITLTHSGDVELTATMNDNCTIATSTDLTALGYDIATVNGLSSGADATDTGSLDGVDVVARATGCSSANEDNPVWATSPSIEWAAEGTLANGLGVKVTDGGEMAFTGNFGTLTFAGDGAVKASRANAKGDTTVTGLDLEGHPNSTSGTAGMVVNWQAPSLGGVDLWVSYAPNSADAGLDSSPFTDTFAIGGQISAGDMTFSAGFENASGGSACAASSARNVAGATLQAQLNGLLGGVACGDETLTAIGMSMSAAGLDINAGWSELDTDGSDQTTMNIGLGTSVGDYSVSVDYVNAEKAYQITGKDVQTTLGLGVSTSLGDGVDLGLNFSTNDYDLAGHKENNYNAEASLKVSF
jgi:hypothetical protein